MHNTNILVCTLKKTDLNISFKEVTGMLYSTQTKYAKAKLLALPRGGMSKTQMGGNHYILIFSKAQGETTHSHNEDEREGRSAAIVMTATEFMANVAFILKTAALTVTAMK